MKPIPSRILIPLLAVLLSGTATTSADDETIVLELAPRARGAAAAGKAPAGPRWSPKNGSIDLEATTAGLVGRIALGPAKTATIFQLKGTRDGPFDTLQIDLDGDGKLEKGEVLRSEPNPRGWITWNVTLAVPFPELETSLDWPVFLMYAPDESRPASKLVVRYGLRGFLQGRGKAKGVGKLEAILVDFDQDGQFTLEADRWALAEAGDEETLYAPGTARPLTRHGWVGETALKVVSVRADGRELVLAPVVPEKTREEERIADDPYHADKQEKRSGKSVTFLHDFEEAEKLARKKKRPLLVDFETDWCGPCRKMDELVYTADRVVALQKGYVFVKVDGDEREDLAKRFEVSAYPTLVLLGPDGEEVGRRVGYQGVAELEEWLKR